jgi:hypothetical protein
VSTPVLPKPCWYCNERTRSTRDRYCQTCLRRIERTGCVDLDEYPTQQDAHRAWAPGVLRAFVIGLVLLFAVPAWAEDFSRSEVEQLLGAPVDDYDPAELGPGHVPGYATGTRVLVWDVASRPNFSSPISMKPGRWLVVVVIGPGGQLVEVRCSSMLEAGPVYDDTATVRRILRTRRT